MRSRVKTRDVVLSAAIAAAAYFTAAPPYAVSRLEPGRPDAPRRATSATSRRPDAAGDLRDALNAGSSAPHRQAPTSPAASDFTRGLTASSPGMTSAAVPLTPSSPARSLPREPDRAASAPEPQGNTGDARKSRPRARAASLAGKLAAAGEKALREASADVEDPSGTTARGFDASHPTHDAARRARWSEDETSAATVDPRGRRRRASSLFEPTRRSRRESRRTALRTPRFRPPRLSQLLGGRALRPPPASLRPPVGLALLPSKRPDFDAGGRIVPPPSRELGALEAVSPDKIVSDRRRNVHWDGETWHEKHAHGLSRDGGWLWLEKDGARWWGLVGKTPLVRHQRLWWLRESGVWLVLHEGEPWAWRHFQDWDAEGLFHPATGTEIVYSPDLSRAAVITPGEGAVVYDARSGAEIGRIPESAMPARRRPKAPKTLSLP